MNNNSMQIENDALFLLKNYPKKDAVFNESPYVTHATRKKKIQLTRVCHCCNRSSVSDYDESALAPKNADIHCLNVIPTIDLYDENSFTGKIMSSLHSCDAHTSQLSPKGGRNSYVNILTAVLYLIKELDSASLQVVDSQIHCRLQDLSCGWKFTTLYQGLHLNCNLLR